MVKNPQLLRELAERLHSGVLLAGLVSEFGYACASSKEAFKQVLRLAPQLDEAALAQLVGTIARTHSGLDSSPANFNRHVFSHTPPEFPLRSAAAAHLYLLL